MQHHLLTRDLLIELRLQGGYKLRPQSCWYLCTENKSIPIRRMSPGLTRTLVPRRDAIRTLLLFSSCDAWRSLLPPAEEGSVHTRYCAWSHVSDYGDRSRVAFVWTHRGSSGPWRRWTFRWCWWRCRSMCPGCAGKHSWSTGSRTAEEQRLTARRPCAMTPWVEEHLTNRGRSKFSICNLRNDKTSEDDQSWPKMSEPVFHNLTWLWKFRYNYKFKIKLSK